MTVRISLHPAGDDKLFGKSKWWGDPELPVDMDYPNYQDDNGEEYPLTFICQVNCSELAAYDTPLPKEGLLCFFARIDYYLGYDDPEVSCEGVWPLEDTRVIYVAPEDMPRIETKILVDENDEPMALPCRRIEWQYCASGKDDCDGHKLLGSPFMIPWEDWDAPCEGWKVLLQVDTDEGDDYTLRFMDDGVFYFLIAPDDLQKGRFSQVRGFMISM